MTDTRFNQQLGTLAPDKSLRLQRRLPGPIERVWAYLTEPDKRATWLAGGPMGLTRDSAGMMCPLGRCPGKLKGPSTAP